MKKSTKPRSTNAPRAALAGVAFLALAATAVPAAGAVIGQETDAPAATDSGAAPETVEELTERAREIREERRDGENVSAWAAHVRLAQFTSIVAAHREWAAEVERAEAARAAAERAAAERAAAQRRASNRGSGSAGMAALRNCESGGNYGAVSSSGTYRGAYQFSRATWNSVAAGSFPHLVGVDPAAASPADQDAMANALRARAGSSPWPHCGRHL